jgi:aquaporin Z
MNADYIPIVGHQNDFVIILIIMFAIAGVVLLVGGFSGAHLNPAMTVGALVTRKIGAWRAVGYIVAQFLGALAALGLLTIFVHGANQPEASAQLYGQAAPTVFAANPITAGKEWYLFFSELVGTAILGFAVATALRAGKDRVSAALTVGFGIFVGLLFAATAASYVGGSAIINPAVAASLDAIKWSVWPLAIYVLAPVIGGVVGFVLNDVMRASAKQ